MSCGQPMSFWCAFWRSARSLSAIRSAAAGIILAPGSLTWYVVAMTDQFTIRIATAADASTLAGQRAAMFRDMGVLPQHLDAPLVDASRHYFEEAIPSGEYL